MFSASSRAGTITTTRGHRLGDFSSAVSSCTCQKFPRAKNRYSQLAKGMAASRVGVRGTRYFATKKFWSGPFSVFIENRNVFPGRSEEHTSELQSRLHLVCRLLLEKKKKKKIKTIIIKQNTLLTSNLLYTPT